MVFRETMKQSTGISAIHHTPSSLSALFDEFEIEVSEVLLNLPNLIYKSESRYRFRIRWGAKRRRSAIDSTPSTPSPSSLSPSPSPPQGESETQRRAKLVKVEASSPATPLSFSPSESDEKPKRSHKKALNKKTREEWLEIIESLSRQKKLLSGELETLKSYHKKLKSFNLELKAKSHRLNFGQSFLNQPMLQSLYVEDQDHRSEIHYAAHQQPCIVDDRTVYSSQANGDFQYPSHGQMTQVSSLSPGLGLNKINHKSPIGIPDLNVALDDETFGMDSPQPLGPIKALAVADNRVKAAAAAAEARRRRMVKIREMKSSIKPPRCR